MGAFAEMSWEVSQIIEITAYHLARTHVSYYNDDAKHTEGMYRRKPRRHGGTRRTAVLPAERPTKHLCPHRFNGARGLKR